jgi:acetolactate synthase-1/2/3 large subunit
MRKKVSDLVIDFLEEKGIYNVFLLTGGGIMHLTDSLANSKKVKYTCNYHEQASAIAAEGYARVSNKPAVCMSTIGPGIANALSGAIGAWHDSIPIILICGQVKSEIKADFTKIRQRGPQEADILSIAKPITKYAVSITNPNSIKYELEKAYQISRLGRPGPVLIEIPLDIQASIIECDDLIIYKNNDDKHEILDADREIVIKVLNYIRNSNFPILFPGNGIKLANAFNEWVRFYYLLNIPCVLPLTAKDLLPDDYDYNLGIIGTLGQRRANFAVQNSDCFISLASGINVSKIGFNINGFAPNAIKIILDIDHGQIYYQALRPDFGIEMDVKVFLTIAIDELKRNPIKSKKKWLEACKFWKEKYKIITPDFYIDKKHVNMYVFHDMISNICDNDSIIVTGNGMEAQSLFQSFKNKKGQQILIPGNWGAMGWDLPTAVGAATYAKKHNKKVILITGDGSIMLNIQELLTVKYNDLPIKIFVFNNKGYALIRTTQETLLNNNLVGSDNKTGVINPDFKLLGNSFRIKYDIINNNQEIEKKLIKILNSDEQILCEVNISYDAKVVPKSIAFKNSEGIIESKPLEDMYPFLPKDEIEMNMNLLKNKK